MIPGYLKPSLQSAPIITIMPSADECCAFVCDNKASIYYFDIKANQWTEYQIPNGEKPNLLAASDDVFLAVGDSSIIGYSSILQQVNFRRFEGNPV